MIVLNGEFALRPDEIVDAETIRAFLRFEEFGKSMFSEIDFATEDKQFISLKHKVAPRSKILPTDDIKLFEQYFARWSQT